MVTKIALVISIILLLCLPLLVMIPTFLIIYAIDAEEPRRLPKRDNQMILEDIKE